MMLSSFQVMASAEEEVLVVVGANADAQAIVMAWIRSESFMMK